MLFDVVAAAVVVVCWLLLSVVCVAGDVQWSLLLVVVGCRYRFSRLFGLLVVDR